MIKTQTDRQQSRTCRLVLMENPHEGPVAVKSAVARLSRAVLTLAVCLASLSVPDKRTPSISLSGLDTRVSFSADDHVELSSRPGHSCFLQN